MLSFSVDGSFLVLMNLTRWWHDLTKFPLKFLDLLKGFIGFGHGCSLLWRESYKEFFYLVKRKVLAGQVELYTP
jgi:hypothetical protein